MKKQICLILALVLVLPLISGLGLAQDEVEKVIVASEENYPDAIISSVVTQKLGIPVILTEKDNLSEEALTTLEELNPNKVIVVGGPAVVSEDVVNTLSENYDVKRLWGMTRYETAVEINLEFWSEGSEKAVLVEDNFGPESRRYETLATAKELAEDQPIFLFPSGKIPAQVLSALTELEVQEVKIIGTEITDNMTEELESIGIQVEEIIESENEDELSENVQERVRNRWEKFDEMIVVAAQSFKDAISAPSTPQGKSYIVRSEDQIETLIEVISEKNITKIKIVGNPSLAEIINESLAEIEGLEIETRRGNAIQNAARFARENKNAFKEKYQEKIQKMQQKMEAKEEQIRERARDMINITDNLSANYENQELKEKLQEAKEELQNGNYEEALEIARQARMMVKGLRWNMIKGNQTAIQQEVEDEVSDLREKVREMTQINRQFAEQMQQNMSVQERLQVIKEFKGMHREQVREIVKTATQMRKQNAEEIKEWLRKARDDGEKEMEDDDENETEIDDNEKEIPEDCEDDIEAAEEAAEDQMCTQQVQNLKCPNADYTYMARNGCEISYLKEQGWTIASGSGK